MNNNDISLSINTILAQQCIDDGEYKQAAKFIEVIKQHDLSPEQSAVVEIVETSVNKASKADNN